MDNLFASVQSIMNTTEISNQQKLEMVNTLIGRTIEIEKLSILQSILSEINKKGSRDIELNQIYTNLKTKAGKVAADRFNEMTAEKQEIIEKHIMSIKLDESKLKDIMTSPYINYANVSTELNQIDCKSELPPISIEDSSVKSLKMVSSSSNLDTKINKAIEQYENGEPVNLTINPSELYNVKVTTDTAANSVEGISDPGYNNSITTSTGLVLKLHSVKCLRKLHRIKSDKISMGCETIDDKDVHEKIAEFQVDNSFDANDIISYDEPKALKLFSLDSSYPKTFSAYILLVEKGSVGVGNLFTKFYNAIKDDLPDLATFCGKAAGLEISDIGGKLIGKAAGLALDSLIRWLSEAFNDDMFPAKQVFTIFQSAPEGQLKSPIKKLTFKFHAAEYEVCCSWEVTKPKSAQLPISVNQETTINSIQQAETLPRLNQFVIFHVNPLLIKSPVPLPNPYIVGRVCSEGYSFNEAKPELRAEVWFGGFSMIEVTIPMAAIYEWHEFQRCMVT